MKSSWAIFDGDVITALAAVNMFVCTSCITWSVCSFVKWKVNGYVCLMCSFNWATAWGQARYMNELGGGMANRNY